MAPDLSAAERAAGPEIPASCPETLGPATGKGRPDLLS